MTQQKQQSVRSNHGFAETMQRHFANMENALYAAEQLCPRAKPRQESYNQGWAYACSEPCVFRSVNNFCKLNGIRLHLGEHVEQHDVEARR